VKHHKGNSYSSHLGVVSRMGHHNEHYDGDEYHHKDGYRNEHRHRDGEHYNHRNNYRHNGYEGSRLAVSSRTGDWYGEKPYEHHGDRDQERRHGKGEHREYHGKEEQYRGNDGDYRYNRYQWNK
jgi:hypothetical protein